MTKNLDRHFRSSISHAALTASLAISLTTIPDFARAQDRAIELGTITVEGPASSGSYNTLTASSPKQTAPLLDTPQTVTVIPQAVIREQGARNLTEVLRNTPGISFDAGENGFATSTNNFKIRGFDGSGNIYHRRRARFRQLYPRRLQRRPRRGVQGIGRRQRPRRRRRLRQHGHQDAVASRTSSSAKPASASTSTMSKSRKRGDHRRQPGDRAEHGGLRINGLLERQRRGRPRRGREQAAGASRRRWPSAWAPISAPILSYEHVTRRDLPDWGVPGATIRGLVTLRSARRPGASRDAFYGLRIGLRQRRQRCAAGPRSNTTSPRTSPSATRRAGRGSIADARLHRSDRLHRRRRSGANADPVLRPRKHLDLAT